jgi:hypothetical protein
VAHSWTDAGDGIRRCAGCGRTELVTESWIVVDGKRFRVETARVLAQGKPPWHCTGAAPRSPDQIRPWWKPAHPAYPEQGAWERPAASDQPGPVDDPAGTLTPWLRYARAAGLADPPPDD